MQTKAFIVLVVVTVSYGAPNHLKAVVVEKQAPVNGVTIGGLGASASWGGYSAGAGLGGGAGGGGLFAGASAPEGSASAGLGGIGASAGASAGTGGHQSGGGGFFDSIFNIPISVLRSVNKHLNSSGKTVAVHGGTSTGTSTGTASATAEASAGASANAGGSVTYRKNYDSAFAIPISALTSVNQFLNGK